MAIDQKAVAEYAAELADAAGIPAEQRSAFLSNDKVLAAARKRFEDVERERGRVKAAEEARQNDYQENLKIFNHNKQAVEEAQKLVADYEARFGKLSPEARAVAVREATQDVIDKKTFEESIANTQNMAVELSKIAVTIGLDYYQKTGKVLDMDAVQKIAMEQKLNAKQAYEKFLQPELDAKQKADYEKQLQTKYEEGLREGASKRAAAEVGSGGPQNGFMANYSKKAEEVPKATVSGGFMEAWTGWKPSQTS